MTKALSFALSCALGASFAFLASPGKLLSQEAPPAAAPRKSPFVESTDTRTAEQAYKNIKIFTGMPATRLETVMRGWKDALGAECTLCHVRGQWDKDDLEEKGTARAMKTMVDDIAKNNFNGKYEVTCYTCHRGDKHPAKNPPAAPVQRQARPVEPNPGF